MPKCTAAKDEKEFCGPRCGKLATHETILGPRCDVCAETLRVAARDPNMFLNALKGRARTEEEIAKLVRRLS